MGRDWGRIIGVTAFIVALATLLIGLSALGIKQDKTFETIDVDGLWAGICAGLPTIMFPFLLVEMSRADNGYRRKGLTSLLLLATLTACDLEVLVMMTRPLMLGDSAVMAVDARPRAHFPMRHLGLLPRPTGAESPKSSMHTAKSCLLRERAGSMRMVSISGTPQ